MQGGTAAAPGELNDRNRWEPGNAWADAEHCDFFVGLQYPSEPPLQGVLCAGVCIYPVRPNNTADPDWTHIPCVRDNRCLILFEELA